MSIREQSKQTIYFGKYKPQKAMDGINGEYMHTTVYMI